MRMKTKIIAGMVTALLLATMLTITAFYVSPVRAITISYSPIELYQDTTLQTDYQFIGCDGFIVKNIYYLTLDLNGHKVIGQPGERLWHGITVNGSELTQPYGEIYIKNGVIESFGTAIFITEYGGGDTFANVENIKTKGCTIVYIDRSWVRIGDCDFNARYASASTYARSCVVMMWNTKWGTGK